MHDLEGKWPIWGSMTATILAFVAVLLVMFMVDPFRATASEKTIFFASLFIGVWGLVTLIFFTIRRLWSKHLSSLYVFNLSLWQGLLTAVFLLSFLIYQVRPWE